MTATSGSSAASGLASPTAPSGGEGGDKSGYGQSCGTNDISWSVSSESEAGGYYLVKAKPGRPPPRRGAWS
ncbi:hypothetical protein [Streptomyces jeddahensis]|uniref:hypothetical protein n=1 Tax=Streptomyces jeddahensis TaxID=1716141 RepID=UPI000A6AD8DA|nr:hypothetical protein [Streptomyces jeddahensis]